MITDKMDKVAEEICHSLENEPENWQFGPSTFTHTKGKFNGAEFWRETIELWDGITTHIIFSRDQARTIKVSYRKARNKVGNTMQNNLFDSLSTSANEKESALQGKEQIKSDKTQFLSDFEKLLDVYGVSNIAVSESRLFGNSIRFEFKNGGKENINTDLFNKS